jgi:hypothetical protein
MRSAALHSCACPTCRGKGNVQIRAYHHQINLFLSRLDEQQRRWYAGLESLRVGHGGDRFSAQLTGLSERTVRRGRLELGTALSDCPTGRVRHAGAGRPAAEVHDLALEHTLIEWVEPETAGDPQGQGKYKRSSLRELAARLQESGHPVSPVTVGRLLKKHGYSLRVNARRKEAKSSPPERDAQFVHIDDVKGDFLAAGEPVISVDTKKKN